MKRKIDITIDLKSKYLNTVYLKQMDTTVFFIKLIDDSVIVDLTSQIVDIIFTKPDNTIVQQMSSNIDFENGIAVIQLHEDCLRMSGKAKMEVEIKNTNSEVISSFYIPIQIEKTSKENINSSNTPNYYEEFSKAIDDFKEDSAQLLEDLSDSFYETIEEELKDTVIENSEEEISRYTQNKKVELDEYTQLKEEELTQVQNRYAKALKKKVESTEFIQIYSDNNKIEDLEISGEELRQETREGYNKFNLTGINSEAEGTFENGKIQLNWTKGFDVFLLNNNNLNTALDITKNYTVVFKHKGDAISVRDYNNNENKVVTGTNTNYVKYLFTFTNVSSLRLDIIRSASSGTAEITDVMLLEGTYTISTVPEYESYGASPSPEYPSEIENSGSNENLFDKNNANIVNAYLADSGTLNSSSKARSIIFNCNSNQNYVISKISTYYFRVAEYVELPVVGSTYNNIIKLDTNTKISYTTSDNANYLVITFYKGNDGESTEQEILNSLKIEKGTAATPSSLYGCRSFEIEDVGKNFFDYTKSTSGKRISIYSGNPYDRVDYSISDYTKVPKNSEIVINNGATSSYSAEYDENKIYIAGHTELNYITSDNTKYIRFDYPTENENITQLELYRATEYEPHQSTTSLINFPATEIIGSMNEVENAIKKIDGVWKIEKNIGIKVFAGNENTWQRYVFESTKYQYYIGISNVAHFATSTTTKSNLFKASFLNNRWNENCLVYTYNGGIAFRFDGSTTTDEWKAFLAQQYSNGMPVKVYYQLAEPEYITLPEETQEVLNNLEIIYGINNISISSNGKISFTYNQEISRALAERDERIERLEQAILNLEEAE